MTEKTCPHCDASVFSPDAELCWRCGRSLSSAPTEPDRSNTGDAGGDWLENLRDDSADELSWVSGDELKLDNLSASDDDEIPDWLARVRQRNQEGRDPDDEDKVPEWLLNLQREGRVADMPAPPVNDATQNSAGTEPAEEAGAAQPESAPASEQDSGPENGWLAGFDEWEDGQETAGSRGALVFSPDNEDEEDKALSEWLSRLNDPGEVQPGESPQEAPTASFGWVPEKPADEPGEPDIWEGIGSTGAVDSEADWFANLMEPPAQASEEAPSAETAGEEIDFDQPEEEGLDWLSEEPAKTSTEPVQSVEQAQPTEEEEITPAELPVWIESLRPVESVTPRAASQPEREVTEESGPLAGLPGVIPINRAPMEYTPPTAYPVQLKVTDKQRTHAALLEEMLAEEGKPKNIKHSGRKRSGAGLRLFVSLLVLTGLMLSATLTGSASANDPLTGAVRVDSYFQDLPSGVILVAADFNPAYTAEMKLAASGILQDLLQGDNDLALVSTLPTGPILGEELLQAAAGETGLAQNDLSGRSVNLGYLAGGEVSLQEFALRPQFATRYGFAASLAGDQVWQQPVLAGVSNIQDFSLLLVFTDSPERGRAWVEQVLPMAGDVPLVMVASAQAAPLLQPYLNSGQIDVLVSGLAGGVTYRSFSQTESRGLQGFWNAYRIGVLLFIGIIALAVLLQSLVSSGPERDDDEA